jgi:pyridoxamine 5'-phosphate oxidase
VEQRFAGDSAVPRPPHWGAWLIEPRRIEFWQGRRSRLHDRLVYSRQSGDWRIERLQP